MIIINVDVFSIFSSEFLVVFWSDQELFSVILLLDHISLYSTMDI